ncbi:MAG: hypothetical protein INF79_12470 [Roseomonas sp.]|nr:hypothetical protein [Roseomonas sp.]
MAAARQGHRRMKPRPSHKRFEESQQAIWIIFGGRADQAWLYPLKRGFRHCFAAIKDADGWTVLDPLSGRLLVARLPLDAAFDLPGFYRRAGLRVSGPFTPGPAAPRRLPPIFGLSCVALCRALLGADAPRAVTPYGLYRRLQKRNRKNFRKNVLTRARH